MHSNANEANIPEDYSIHHSELPHDRKGILEIIGIVGTLQRSF